MKKTINYGKKLFEHLKKNTALYIITAVIGYIVYQIVKMISDTGKDSNGNVYYKEFEEPEDIEEE